MNKEKSQDFMPDLSEAGISKLTFFPFSFCLLLGTVIYLLAMPVARVNVQQALFIHFITVLPTKPRAKNPI